MNWLDRLKSWLNEPLVRGEQEQKFTPADATVDWPRVEVLVHGPGTPPWGSSEGGDGNSAVFACLMALALAYPEPPITVYTKRASSKRTGRRTALPNHPLQALLDKPTPNGELSMEDLWFWTAWAKHCDGNAYWLKVRAGDAVRGNVVELWPVSPSLISPVTEKDSDGRADEWISYYRMQVAPNKYERVPKENVIHFRLGVDNKDMRKGLSPLKRLVRQISTDEEADKFTDALLKNYAVPGLVVIPGQDTVVDEEAANRIKAAMQQNFSNDGRGAIAVLSQESKVEQFGFSPEQMNMDILHRIPEERIAAVIGVPAIVAGLGAGLDRATFANFREAREMLTEQRLVPLWRQDAARLNVSLKDDFTQDRNIFVDFDLTNLRALQEDEDAKYVRLNTGVAGGWITVNEARTDVGFDEVEGGDELSVTSADGESKSSSPILGYHIEQGVVGRNEARASLGLPPEDTGESDKLRRLTAQLTVAQAAVNAGIPAQQALDLVGLKVEIEKDDPAVPVPPEGDEEPADEEPGEGEKRLPFGTNGYRSNGHHNGTIESTTVKANTRQLINQRRQVRGRVVRSAEKDITGWFKQVAAAVLRQAGKSRQVKALTQNEWLRLLAQIFNQEAPALEGIIANHALDVIAGTWGSINTELQQVIQFNENDPLVLDILETAGDNIRGITQTTLDELRAILPGLYEEGLPSSKIAERISGLISETYSGRSLAIARTEIGLAQQSATTGRYENAGVKYVEVFDNGFDNSHEFCKRVNGKVVTLEWAERNPLQHPNCVRGFGAVFDYDGPVFEEEEPWN